MSMRSRVTFRLKSVEKQRLRDLAGASQATMSDIVRGTLLVSLKGFDAPRRKKAPPFERKP